jgi:hypothetical protein
MSKEGRNSRREKLVEGETAGKFHEILVSSADRFGQTDHKNVGKV